MTRILTALALFALLCAPLATATADDVREVRGVDLPLQVSVGDHELHLNGAGVRSRFFVRVYVGALYTTESVTDASEAITMDAPRRIHLAMLRDVGRDTMVDALEDGLESAMTSEQRVDYADAIETFKSFFPGDFNEGYTGDIDVIPGEGLIVSMNGEELGRIESDTFAQFVLAIWLGDDPADSNVKSGMLEG
ncbi:chalcone isomerase family protein [Aquisalimonas sp. APHAB1-3]|uniref:chalcone isomerase family protein n=1 Tax=unclassified Aquisalimonas TaxID=2644645 RepID=UPI0025C57BF0|nr:chalcone isomerase family protein [Aquisalimonas sp.]